MQERIARPGKKGGTGSGGFTVVELMVSVSISAMVLLAVLSVFIWSGEQAVLAGKSGWSQGEAKATSEKISMYIRTASSIVDIDREEGRWVELQHPDGTTNRLTYINVEPLLRDGRILLLRDGAQVDVIVARGLTEIQNPNGYTIPVFQQTDTNAVRVTYRVSKPIQSGGRDVNDGNYASHVRFSACLRNFEYVNGRQ